MPYKNCDVAADRRQKRNLQVDNSLQTSAISSMFSARALNTGCHSKLAPNQLTILENTFSLGYQRTTETYLWYFVMILAWYSHSIPLYFRWINPRFTPRHFPTLPTVFASQKRSFLVTCRKRWIWLDELWSCHKEISRNWDILAFNSNALITTKVSVADMLKIEV